MAKFSRDKGKVAEREVERRLEQRGFHVIREQDGRTQGADLLVNGTYAVEVKRRERLSLLDWHRQLEGRIPGHLVPMVVWRPNREPWRASLLLADLADLIEEAGA